MLNKVFSGHQPNFFPYMGYFYKMYKSDIFVLDDDVQFSSGEGARHNNTHIKVNGKDYKVTLPVSYNFGDKINEVFISADIRWKRKFFTMLKYNYSKTKYFDEVYKYIEDVFSKDFEKLVDLNIYVIKDLAEKLGLRCKIIIASIDVPTKFTNNRRNVYQCCKVGCNTYYSGLGGKLYNDEKMYTEKGIKVVYTDYVPLKYKQVGMNFIENLSIIDYLFNEGFKLPKEWNYNE